MPSRTIRAAALLLLVPLVAAGCGGADAGESRVAALWRELAALLDAATADGSVPEPALAPETAGDEDRGALDAIASALGASDDDEAAAEPGYWRYTEANGSLRFVESLAEVPAAARATAERVSTAAPRTAAAPRVATRPAPPRHRPSWTAATSEPAAARGSEATVVVYTTSWCGWCRKTLAWLDERGVDYENRDIESNEAWAQELKRKTGGTSIPVVDVDGRIVRGFDPRTLEELL